MQNCFHKNNISEENYLENVTYSPDMYFSYDSVFHFQQKGLHISCLNIQHLIPKLDEIRCMLMSDMCNVDIFAMCETFMNDSISDINLNIPNYSYIRRDRCNKKGGGILVYISDNVSYRHRPDLEHAEIESISIEISYPNTKPFLLNIVYRPPNSHQHWIYIFESMLKSYEEFYHEYHVLGDFNFNFIPEKKSFENKEWTNILLKYGLIQLVNVPTRVTKKSSTIIDHIYTNQPDRLCSVSVPCLSISDHYPVCITRKIKQRLTKREHRVITYRSYKNFNTANFQNDLALKRLQYIESELDPNKAMTMLYDDLNSVLSKHAPLKQKRVKRLTQPGWFNSEVKRYIIERNKLHKMKDWENYKIMRNKVTSIIRKNKRDYFNNAIKDKSNVKDLWKTIKGASNNDYNNSCVETGLPLEMCFNKVTIKGKYNIINAFNDHFIRTSEQVEKINLNEDNFIKLKLELDKKIKHDKFEINLVSPYEVRKIIDSLKVNKATGIDCIGANILKMCGDHIIIPITSIINNSILSGIFPDSLKYAYVLPLYKNSNREDGNNYRPISILPTISKIFERHLNNQLNSFLAKHHILSNSQSGFRDNHSCQTALIHLVNNWIKHVDDGKLIGSVFIDLRKAFDLVDHSILLYKLKLHHFSEHSLSLFQSYLSNRNQVVKHGNLFSTPKTVESGVPQGSILGPTLFLIYINDIQLTLSKSNIDLYADDSTLSVAGSCISEIQTKLQSDINSVLKWCSINNMLINPNKTKCMLIGNNKKINTDSLNLNINGMCIENVESHKVLGLHIDKNLKWKTHINKTCSKINSKLALLRRITYFLTFDMKKLFYSSYILSHFDYACTLWGWAAKKDILKISILQKRAAKIILQKPMRTPSKELFSELNWLTFDNRCKYHAAIVVYKCMHNMAPDYLKDIVTFCSNSKYMLRSTTNKDLITNKPNSLFIKKSFSFMCKEIWNALPPSLRSTSTITYFKHNLKLYLLSCQ